MHIEFPKKSKEIITRPLPSGLIKERKGGGKTMLSYISGSTVIDILNNAFDYLWSWEVKRQWIQPSEAKFNPKYDSEPVPQGPVAHVTGRLTVHLINDKGEMVHLVKEASGSKSIMGGQSDQESIFKAAGTDALKKAASLLGIGLELYRDDDEQAYFYEMNYEDPWTDEMEAMYESERNYIKEIMSANDLGAEDMSPYIIEFSNGALSTLYDIVPDNIQAFVEFLKQKSEEATE